MDVSDALGSTLKKFLRLLTEQTLSEVLLDSCDPGCCLLADGLGSLGDLDSRNFVVTDALDELVSAVTMASFILSNTSEKRISTSIASTAAKTTGEGSVAQVLKLGRLAELVDRALPADAE